MANMSSIIEKHDKTRTSMTVSYKSLNRSGAIAKSQTSALLTESD